MESQTMNQQQNLSQKTLETTSHSKIVIDNIDLVRSIARKFPNTPSCDFDDYVSVGTLAFLNCLKKYDATKGKISTWATRPIFWAILQEYRKHKKHRHAELIDKEYVQEHDWEMLPDLSAKETQIVDLLRQDFNFKEIAQKLGTSRLTLSKSVKSLRRKIV